jgi:hypothetical protein
MPEHYAAEGRRVNEPLDPRLPHLLAVASSGRFGAGRRAPLRKTPGLTTAK